MTPTDAAQTEQVRLSADTAAKLRVIAAAGRKSMGESLDEIAGDAIDSAYQAVIDAAASAPTGRRRVQPHHDLGGEG